MFVLLAALLVGIMGVYLKLGNTCLVASTEQMFKHKNPSKFLEIINSWFWVILLITSLQLTIGFNVIIKSFALSWMTFVGGILLGLGAYFNRACTVGTISKIGIGNLNYLFTPIGMLISVFIFYHLPIDGPQQINDVSPITLYPILFFIISVVAIIFLFIYFTPRNKNLKFKQKIIGAPTTIISICFVLLLLLKKPWSYTNVISDISQNNFNNKTENLILFLIFFIAVISTGFFTKSYKPIPLKLKTVFNCLIGGALIGWGSQLIIGSHDTITLYGFPLLLTTAVIAFLVNTFTIAACIKLFG
jgi:toxin CptA